MFFFTKYFEGYRNLIKSINDSERSPIQKRIGKFLATFKVIIDMVFTIVILIVTIGWLFGLI